MALATSINAAGSPLISTYFVLPFAFLLKLIFAVQATRFFVESRRSGALDFLLCTPLTTREIVRGHGKALAVAFFWPVMIFVALLFVPTSLLVTQALGNGGLDRALTVVSGSFLAVLTVVRLAMDLFALCWFGMALALTSRRPSLASAKTVLLVLILPSIFSFCWLDIVADIFCIAWGVSKLQGELRNLVTSESRNARCPTISFSRIGAPPIIAK
jgi:hypothetical protein